MAGEWRQHEVSALIDGGSLFIGDGYRAKNEELASSGLPFARAGNINNGFQFEDADHFPETSLSRVGNKISQTGDVVFTSKGTVGRFAFVCPGTPRFVYSPQLCFWRALDKTLIDSRFLYFWMYGREFFVQFKGVAGQTDMAEYVSLSDQRRMHITLPPLPEQRAIAHILGTLDDKIELNRRMSETLEAMARALFQSWFVDFDPVRAKMNLPSPSGRGAGGEGTSSAQHPKAPIPTALLDFARQLRRQSTDAEALLWRLLRGRQIASAKFRRQHSFSPYILDFYCHELKLAVELDGGQHNEEAGRRRDARRDAYLAEHGIRVLRFWNNDVFRETEAVLEAIYAAVVERSSGVPSPPAPLPEGEGSVSPSPSGRRVWEEGMPAIPPHILDLFPDRLVDSEIGEIPEGWMVKPIGELAEVVGGSTPKTERAEYWEGGTHHWVTPKDLSGLSMPVLLDTERKITDAGLAQISSGLLPSGTVLLSSRAPIGYLAITEIPAAINQGFIAMKPRQGISNLFLLRWAETTHDEIVSRANGSTFLEISKANFRPIHTVAPSSPVMEAFDRLSRPLYRKVVEQERESRTLATLRDALLPKLISGELRVKDAEKFIGRAV